MIILGIDPGTTTVGFALIKKENSKMKLIDYGVFKTTPKIDLSLKILEIGTDINHIIQKYNPEILSIEKLFFQTNTKTAIDVAQARGVIVYEAIKNNIKISDYTPLQVKKAITGNGKANKLQLQNAIKMIFGLETIPKPDDAADAIGLAYMGALNSKNLI
ncbi:MAG: crossover junction endodeoxyribonuclease RuvC [Candidatus Gracilibacteria bacterium]|nr:crossover junction endodeoxyribonuclease RuvC [Candidatus Gracilibacteria bacterium]